ncbi:MAG: FKBP-type peptidyl-prolyl cis-trans isomerase, partial [Chloroflexota bacterium]
MTTTRVTGGQVVSMEYTLRVDGNVVDSSAGGDPLEYLHGAANIIPGLERELEGM